MTRVTFTAARRGRSELFARDHVLRGLASQFSCGPAEVPLAVDKLRRDVEAATGEATQLRSRLATAIIAQLPADGAVIAQLPVDAELLRSIAAKLAGSGRDAILSTADASGDAGATVILMRATGSPLDCGALWKKLAARHGGRGGGRADRADGKLPAALADWPAAVAEATAG
jgi:alanyl-tRNA synthetase